MRRDVIAVRMRDKREWLSVPRVEPKVVVRQIDAAVVTNFDHEKFYVRNCAGETGIRWIERSALGVKKWREAAYSSTSRAGARDPPDSEPALISGCIDSVLQFPFHDSDEVCDDFSFSSSLRRQCPGCGRAKAVIEGGPITSRLEW